MAFAPLPNGHLRPACIPPGLSSAPFHRLAKKVRRCPLRPNEAWDRAATMVPATTVARGRKGCVKARPLRREAYGAMGPRRVRPAMRASGDGPWSSEQRRGAGALPGSCRSLMPKGASEGDVRRRSWRETLPSEGLVPVMPSLLGQELGLGFGSETPPRAEARVPVHLESKTCGSGYSPDKRRLCAAEKLQWSTTSFPIFTIIPACR
jgi:hypothetical protein